MEGGLPMLNCLLQHTLRSLCLCSDNSKWVYAVFWRILPRNYPPPKWDHGGGLLDRSKGNKRNWILVWEDGFCDFVECERAGNGYGKTSFGADIFFKMTHQVYNFGEGLVGKVASDNSHKWVYRDSPTENDPSFISSWNISIDPQPRAWEAQFSSGIETIALISVREGAIQLGSFDKVVEDLNMVLSIQRKFSYLQSIPSVCPMQRPLLPIANRHVSYTNPHGLMQATNGMLNGVEDRHQAIGTKRRHWEQLNDDDEHAKSICLGYNSQHGAGAGGLPMWPIPPLFPSNIRPFFPSVPVPYYGHEAFDHGGISINGNLRSASSVKMKVGEISDVDVKVEITAGGQEGGVDEEEKPRLLDQFGFEARREGESCCKS